MLAVSVPVTGPRCRQKSTTLVIEAIPLLKSTVWSGQNEDCIVEKSSEV